MNKGIETIKKVTQNHLNYVRKKQIGFMSILGRWSWAWEFTFEIPVPRRQRQEECLGLRPA